MPIVAQQVPISVTTRDASPYRFVRAQMEAFPASSGRKELKLVFAKTSTTPAPFAFMGKADGTMDGFFVVTGDPKANDVSVWIPPDYPQGVSSLNFWLSGPGNRKSLWSVQGLPPQTVPTPAIRDSQTIAPGVTVSGTASYWSFQIEAALNIAFPERDGGWYWEVQMKSPYAPPENRDPQDWMITTGKDNFQTFTSCGMLSDRINVEGEVDHFVSNKEEAEGTIHARREPGTGRWILDGEPIFTTKSGFRFKISPVDELVDRDPANKDKLRFTIEFDPTTLDSGLEKEPDRCDITIVPPQMFNGFSPGLSLNDLKRKASAIWTLTDVKTELPVKIHINRRIADRRLPFSLVLSLKPQDNPQTRPATTVNP